jgi:hypothetical protein
LKIKETSNFSFFQNIAESKEHPVSVLYKKKFNQKTSSFIQVFKKRIKRTGGYPERTDKEPAVWG